MPQQRSPGLTSYFGNETPRAPSEGKRRHIEARQTLSNSRFGFDAEPDSVRSSEAPTPRGRRARSSSCLRAASADAPWALDFETAPAAGGRGDDLQLSSRGSARSARASFGGLVRSASAQTARKNLSGGLFEDGLSRQPSERAHQEAFRDSRTGSLQRLGRRSSRALEATSRGEAPWTKGSAASAAPSPHRAISPTPWATHEGADSEARAPKTPEREFQRKGRCHSPRPIEPGSVPPPYATSSDVDKTETQTSASPSKKAAEEEVRVWVEKCMQSHVLAAEGAEASTRSGRRPRSQRLSSGTPTRMRRCTIGQGVSAPKLGPETGPAQISMTTPTRSRLFPTVGQAPGGCQWGGSLRTPRHSTGASTVSLKACSRSDSCESFASDRERAFFGSSKHDFGKSTASLAKISTAPTSTEVPPASPKVAPLPGGPDSGAGGPRTGSPASRANFPSLLEVKKTQTASARHLGVVLQRECADRIEQLKAAKHHMRT